MELNNLTCSKVEKIFAKFKQVYPKPTTALNYSNEFELLVAVILSAQTTDLRVNIVTAELFKIANTPKKMLELTQEQLCFYIKSIGLFRVKSAHILKTCKILVERFNSILPQTREQLEILPGVGRKTANVLLNTLWHYPTIAVDTHVLRGSQRIGLVKKGANPVETELALEKIIPNRYKLNAHNWLIMHGRSVCKAVNPKCDNCLIKTLCRFYQLKNHIGHVNI